MPGPGLEPPQENDRDQGSCDGLPPPDRYNDPWLPASWRVLGSSAQALLHSLAGAEDIPWVCPLSAPRPTPLSSMMVSARVVHSLLQSEVQSRVGVESEYLCAYAVSGLSKAS